MGPSAPGGPVTQGGCTQRPSVLSPQKRFLSLPSSQWCVLLGWGWGVTTGPRSREEHGDRGLHAPPHSGPSEPPGQPLGVRDGVPPVPRSWQWQAPPGGAPPARPAPPTDRPRLPPGLSPLLLSSPAGTLRFSNQFPAATLPGSPSPAPGAPWPPTPRPLTPVASGQPDPSSQDHLARPPGTVSACHSCLGPGCHCGQHAPRGHTRTPPPPAPLTCVSALSTLILWVEMNRSTSVSVCASPSACCGRRGHREGSGAAGQNPPAPQPRGHPRPGWSRRRRESRGAQSRAAVSALCRARERAAGEAALPGG